MKKLFIIFIIFFLQNNGYEVGQELTITGIIFAVEESNKEKWIIQESNGYKNFVVPDFKTALFYKQYVKNNIYVFKLKILEINESEIKVKIIDLPEKYKKNFCLIQ